MTNEEITIIHEKESLSLAIDRNAGLLAYWKGAPKFSGKRAIVRNEAIDFFEKKVSELKAKYAALPSIQY